MKVKDVVAALQRLNQEDEIAATWWVASELIEEAQRIEQTLTQAQAEHLLDDIQGEYEMISIDDKITQTIATDKTFKKGDILKVTGGKYRGKTMSVIEVSQDAVLLQWSEDLGCIYYKDDFDKLEVVK